MAELDPSSFRATELLLLIAAPRAGKFAFPKENVDAHGSVLSDAWIS